MTRPFVDIIKRIQDALRAKDLRLADRLFFDAVEIASSEGMMVSSRGEALIMTLRGGQAKPHDACETVRTGILVGLLIEDTGHKVDRTDFVTGAEKYLVLLMQYADLAVPDEQQRYKVLKEGLQLQVQSGAYYGASVVVEAALGPSKKVSNLEAITMHNNAGAIEVRLGNLDNARNFYQDALNLAQGDEPAQLIQAIQRNLDGVSTGYDPDFAFLPD